MPGSRKGRWVGNSLLATHLSRAAHALGRLKSRILILNTWYMTNPSACSNHDPGASIHYPGDAHGFWTPCTTRGAWLERTESCCGAFGRGSKMRFRSPCKLIHDQAQIGVNDTSPSAVASSVRHYRNLQRVRVYRVCRVVRQCPRRSERSSRSSWRLTGVADTSATAGLRIQCRE